MDDRIRRAFMFLVSLFIISIGVTFIVRADMGNSPLTSMPYTTYAIVPEISFGTWTIIWSVVTIVMEKVLLGRMMSNSQILMQTVMAFVFGYFVDLADLLLGDLSPEGYLMQLVFLLIGCVIMAFGVCIEIGSNFTTLAADGLILAIQYRTRAQFGRIKQLVDIAWCVLSLITGLIFLHGFAGTREGTIIVALLVGPIIRMIQRHIPWLSRT